VVLNIPWSTLLRYENTYIKSEGILALSPLLFYLNGNKLRLPDKKISSKEYFTRYREAAPTAD